MTTTRITAEPGVPFIDITREFAAPRDLLFRAHTDPELLVQWLGPRRLTMHVDRFEIRDGGTWRYTHRDVDRAKAFYSEQLGFVVDVDHSVGDHFRVVQETPPGSACSISIGRGLAESVPGSLQGLQLVVADIEAARAELVARGLNRRLRIRRTALEMWRVHAVSWPDTQNGRLFN